MNKQDEIVRPRTSDVIKTFFMTKTKTLISRPRLQNSFKNKIKTKPRVQDQDQDQDLFVMYT